VWRRSYDVPPPPVAAGSQYDARVDLVRVRVRVKVSVRG